MHMHRFTSSRCSATRWRCLDRYGVGRSARPGAWTSARRGRMTRAGCTQPISPSEHMIMHERMRARARGATLISGLHTHARGHDASSAFSKQKSMVDFVRRRRWVRTAVLRCAAAVGTMNLCVRACVCVWCVHAPPRAPPCEAMRAGACLAVLHATAVVLVALVADQIRPLCEEERGTG